jgi:cytochrome c peroxidase
LAQQNGVTPLDNPIPTDPPNGSARAQIFLGQQLFRDKAISGNASISCNSCHTTAQNLGDGMSIGVGQDAQGTAPFRRNGFQTGFLNTSGLRVPYFHRNSMPLFNVGSEFWRVRLWDGRVQEGTQTIGNLESNGQFISPAGNLLPLGFDNVTAVLECFPPTTDREMLGNIGDHRRNPQDTMVYTGPLNEVASAGISQVEGTQEGSDPEFADQIGAIMGRLSGPLNLAGEPNPYIELFQAAYGHPPINGPQGYVDVGNAMSAFLKVAFTYINSPFEQYLRGDDTALNAQEKRGMLVFFTNGRCVACHNGPLLTDQDFHNIGVPQIGPGNIAGLDSTAPNGEIATKSDYGRFGRTLIESDKFKFRTPTLHSTALTGPFMHDGTFFTLEAAVRHHLNVQGSFQTYNAAQVFPQQLLDPNLGGGPVNRDPILTTNLDPVVANGIPLTEEEIQDLLAFLNALTDPAALTTLDRANPTGRFATISPSGMPISDSFGGNP